MEEGVGVGGCAGSAQSSLVVGVKVVVLEVVGESIFLLARLLSGVLGVKGGEDGDSSIAGAGAEGMKAGAEEENVGELVVVVVVVDVVAPIPRM